MRGSDKIKLVGGGTRLGAAGVRVSNVSLSKLDGHAEIGFDVAWNGSWRHADGRRGNNWDAAWMFIKVNASEHLVLEDSEVIRGGLDRGDGRALFAALAQQSALGQATSNWVSKSTTVTAVEPGKAWRLNVKRALRVSGPGSHEQVQDRIDVRWQPATEGRPAQLRVRRHGPWSHVFVSPDPSHHNAPAGAVMVPAEDGTGLFVHRSADNLGEGPVRFEGAKVRGSLGHEGDGFSGEITLWVFGLEMVYLPEGPFSLGDPRGTDGPSACFYDSLKAEGDVTFLVDSEAEIELADGKSPTSKAKLLWFDPNESDEYRGERASLVPEAFPKGFNAVYMMKRQITQGEYASFVSTLPGPARTSRFPFGGQGDYRYTIFKTPTGKRIATRPSRACNWVNWTDGTAFAAWAGLRPMSELEYEKACRGPLPAVSNEFAWGTASIEQAQVIVGSEEDDEGAVSGNCHFGNMLLVGGDGDYGPVRDDGFAGPGRRYSEGLYPGGRARFQATAGEPPRPVAVDEREATGASYYGVMGLSGNLWELCVTVSNEVGCTFTGKHGQGTLDGYGVADFASLGWPGSNALGTGFRGGSWYTAVDEVHVADWTYGGGLTGYSMRSHDTGFRCVRAAPRGG